MSDTKKEFQTPQGKMMAALGLDTCRACGRDIQETETRHVATSRTTWHDTGTGRTGPHRTNRSARCLDCGPEPEQLQQ